MKTIKPSDWKRDASRNHCPSIAPDNCLSIHYTLKLGRGKLSIYQIQFAVVEPYASQDMLAFNYVSSFGDNSEDSYGGLVYAHNLDEAKREVVRDANKHIQQDIQLEEEPDMSLEARCSAQIQEWERKLQILETMRLTARREDNTAEVERLATKTGVYRSLIRDLKIITPSTPN